MMKADLRSLTMPVGIRNQVFRLLAAIEVAESVQAVRMAVNRAEGFVLGLETAEALKRDMIEAMYVGFETASEARMETLRTLP
ncbi:hypothetical protein ACI2KS_05730 [Pseudomonas sp. NPDC087358]|uniref:hypothetical protein n=1 Tax=Pseudomonas sp. NPDC087358 TaxID=3364439 RepID=UPI00384E3044